MSKKIALIIPYYGKWPLYFEFFLSSVNNNAQIDILIFSDLTYEGSLPHNVSIIPLSISQFNDLASTNIEITTKVTSPYKLCDFKPTYGLVFHEYIKEYKFWAFGDLDLIFGRIKHFLPTAWNDYDVISFREEWISGSFAIFRNTDFINRLFTKSIYYRERLSSKKFEMFTECSGLYSRLIGRNSDAILSTDTRQSFTWVLKTMEKKGDIKYFAKTNIKESIRPGDFVCYSKGKVTQKDGTEFLHYHYITEKSSTNFSIPRWEIIPDTYYVNKFGFFTASQFFSRNMPLYAAARMVKGKMQLLLKNPKMCRIRFGKLFRKCPS